jgi:hypothetical protein
MINVVCQLMDKLTTYMLDVNNNVEKITTFLILHKM